MTANKKSLCRKGNFSDWSTSWSLWGSFSGFIFKRNNASLPKKSTSKTARTLKKVSKCQHIGSSLVKQVKKRKIAHQTSTSKCVKNSSNSGKVEPDIKKKVAEHISSAKGLKKISNNSKLECSRNKCSSNTEAQTGPLVKTKKQKKMV